MDVWRVCNGSSVTPLKVGRLVDQSIGQTVSQSVAGGKGAGIPAASRQHRGRQARHESANQRARVKTLWKPCLFHNCDARTYLPARPPHLPSPPSSLWCPDLKREVEGQIIAQCLGWPGPKARAKGPARALRSEVYLGGKELDPICPWIIAEGRLVQCIKILQFFLIICVF